MNADKKMNETIYDNDHLRYLIGLIISSRLKQFIKILKNMDALASYVDTIKLVLKECAYSSFNPLSVCDVILRTSGTCRNCV